MIPELKFTTIATSCCGMADTFGYETEHHDVSMKMAELSLLPAVREADAETIIVADGAERQALHAAGVLEMALDG